MRRPTGSQIRTKSHRAPRFGTVPIGTCHNTVLGASGSARYVAFALAKATFLIFAAWRKTVKIERFIAYTFYVPRI